MEPQRGKHWRKAIKVASFLNIDSRWLPVSLDFNSFLTKAWYIPDLFSLVLPFYFTYPPRQPSTYKYYTRQPKKHTKTLILGSSMDRENYTSCSTFQEDDDACSTSFERKAGSNLMYRKIGNRRYLTGRRMRGPDASWRWKCVGY